MAHLFARPADIVRYIVGSLGDRSGDYLYGSVKGLLIITPIAQRPLEHTRDKGLYDVTGEVFEILDVILTLLLRAKARFLWLCKRCGCAHVRARRSIGISGDNRSDLCY